MKRRAMTVLRVGRPGLLERRDGAFAIDELLAQLGQNEPGRCIARRKLECLQQQILGSGEIAFGFAVARPFQAPVGDHVAGGKENRVGHSLILSWPGIVVQRTACFRTPMSPPSRYQWHCAALPSEIAGTSPAMTT